MSVAPARIREIAQALVDDLNLSSQPWAGQFIAQRSYWTSYSLSDLVTFRVDATTPARDWQPEARGGSEEVNYYVRLTFQKKVDRGSTAAIDDLVDTVSAIGDSYKLTETFVDDWSAIKAYTVGNFVMSGQNTFRCILANTNQAVTNATYWKAVNPIQLIEKSNPTLYSPKEGDTKNSFSAVLDFVFRQWSDPP